MKPYQNIFYSLLTSVKPGSFKATLNQIEGYPVRMGIGLKKNWPSTLSLDSFINFIEFCGCNNKILI